MAKRISSLRISWLNPVEKLLIQRNMTENIDLNEILNDMFSKNYIGSCMKLLEIWTEGTVKGAPAI